MNIMQTAMLETYYDVKNMIGKVANQTASKFGGDVDDYVSAGNEAFVDAYHSYHPSQGAAFSTWLWWKLRGAMKTEVAKRAGAVACTGSPDELVDFPDCRRFDFASTAFEFSQDAWAVSTMVMETMSDACDFMHHEDAGETIREGLVRRLSSFGWSCDRIAESFAEIAEALQ